MTFKQQLAEALKIYGVDDVSKLTNSKIVNDGFKKCLSEEDEINLDRQIENETDRMIEENRMIEDHEINFKEEDCEF